jgi:hypothetical protein
LGRFADEALRRSSRKKGQQPVKLHLVRQSALVIVLMSCIASSGVGGIVFNGNVSVGAGTISVGGDWVSGTLAWTIEQENVGDPWEYRYAFSHLRDAPGTSHFILELSDGAVAGDINDLDITPGGDPIIEVKIHTPNNGSANPGMPGPLFGVRFADLINSETHTFVFTIDRAPVWGDFYAKSGSSAFAYNSGFLDVDPTVGPSNGSLLGHILRPDTDGNVATPEAASLLAWVIVGLSFAGLALYRQKGRLNHCKI